MSTVYNAVCVSTVHCVTLCITLCCTGHRALAHVGECQPDVSGRAVRIQWLDQEMLTPRDMQYFLYSSWKLIFTYYVILFIFIAIILIINIIPGSPFNFQGLRAEITFMGSSCAQSASQNHILLRQFTIYFNWSLNFKCLKILGTRRNDISVVFTMAWRAPFDEKN